MHLKGLMKWVGLFSIGLLLFACGGSKSKAKETTEAAVNAPGKVVYLKNNIHAQQQSDRKGAVLFHASYANWVNPGAGHLIIPVNSAVSITVSGSIRGKELLITDQKDGKEIHFEYNLKNAGMGFDEYINLISSPNPVSLTDLSDIDKKGIEAGKALVGMSKDGVRMALGYPAVHRTPNLESNTWVYWHDRYRTMNVEFGADGKVKQIQ